MAILSKGTTFASGDQVTAANLNNLVDAATFDTPTDNSTLQKNGSGLLAVKDSGVTLAKLATDAYTTGTWTPSIGGNATYSSRSGTYTKIGRLVFITATINVSTVGTGSQYIITGLPFTSGVEGSCNVSNFASANSSLVYVTAAIPSGGTAVNIRSTTAAGSTIDASANFFADGAQITFSGLYHT